MDDSCHAVRQILEGNRAGDYYVEIGLCGAWQWTEYASDRYFCARHTSIRTHAEGSVCQKSVVNWNVARRHEPWRELVGTDADVALL